MRADPSTASFTLSQLDQMRFGVRTVSTSCASLDQVEALLAFCHKNQVQFGIVHCPATAIQGVQRLAESGFRLMDTLVEWTCEATAPRPSSSPVPIRHATAADEKVIYDLAQAAFKEYRSHYYNDPHLSRGTAVEVYADWARREALAQNDDHVILVSESRGVPTGFITVLKENPVQGRIVLMAVAPAFQRQGYLKLLLAEAVAWAAAKSLPSLSVTVQLTNQAAHKACADLGFSWAGASYTLHGWFTPPS